MATIREIIAYTPEELVQEFDSLKVDERGIGIMSPKGFFHVLRLRSLKSPAANILKQEMISVGGECATSRSVVLGDPEPQDVIVMGTRRQLAKLGSRLKAQPFGLKQAAGRIEDFLKKTTKSSRRADSLLLTLTGEPSRYPLIMGILNVTPDSFSDGNAYIDTSAAVSHGMTLFEQGGEIVDVGGESTRPGSESVSTEEELGRVLPVITRLREQTDRPISIDTTKAQVAREALEAGATLINDVSAGRHDPQMFEVAAQAECLLILMHMQGKPKTMQQNPHYDYLMDELHGFFDERLTQAAKAGVKEEQIILDPGIGFGKRRGDNYEILRRLGELRIFGRPVAVGVSRKSFLQSELGEMPRDRLEESIAAGTIAMVNGADILRVHDVVPALKSRIVSRRLMGSV
ncbi:MAG: dihydropteroate synthase [Fidelibacterota bacterium]|nr:MAG: dihydropteroate synthase [Candidatus Neomarinimicrobiota bacterium]